MTRSRLVAASCSWVRWRSVGPAPRAPSARRPRTDSGIVCSSQTIRTRQGFVWPRGPARSQHLTENAGTLASVPVRISAALAQAKTLPDPLRPRPASWLKGCNATSLVGPVSPWSLSGSPANTWAVWQEHTARTPTFAPRSRRTDFPAHATKNALANVALFRTMRPMAGATTRRSLTRKDAAAIRCEATTHTWTMVSYISRERFEVTATP